MKKEDITLLPNYPGIRKCCDVLEHSFSNVGSKQAAGASKAIFEAMVVI